MAGLFGNSGLFDGDAGFMTGVALTEQSNAQQKIKLAHAVADARNERDALLVGQQNRAVEEINQIRLENLMALAEYEYDVHAKADVSYTLRTAGEGLKAIAESSVTADPRDLMVLSDRLRAANSALKGEDRGVWIQNRYKVLLENCIFPKNDHEAIMAGGYGMPFSGSVPAFSLSEQDKAANGEPNDDVYTVLTDPEEMAEVHSKLKRGPTRLG